MCREVDGRSLSAKVVGYSAITSTPMSWTAPVVNIKVADALCSFSFWNQSAQHGLKGIDNDRERQEKPTIESEIRQSVHCGRTRHRSAVVSAASKAHGTRDGEFLCGCSTVWVRVFVSRTLEHGLDVENVCLCFCFELKLLG